MRSQAASDRAGRAPAAIAPAAPAAPVTDGNTAARGRGAPDADAAAGADRRGAPDSGSLPERPDVAEVPDDDGLPAPAGTVVARGEEGGVMDGEETMIGEKT
ncbi:hypothetical protein Acav_4536 [Paracidovorax avenae ATCC 19860]|uniref:Uncharacterized protein n=2 Tax=Paracidovorax avenae TaxID=80867 RepID=F0QA51_PARA1|nr:hypothetical protein Acav_4536 [Paracidovorax avenae ATCC 19860]